MEKSAFNQGLLSFIQSSPTPFHAVKVMAETLSKNGFKQVREQDSWNITKGEKYFVTRNDSSIIAFTAGKQAIESCGWRMVGAHTDSPCLKLKPQALYKQNGYWQLGVEIYGGVLLSPWFDRDLSLAGRITFETDDGKLCSELIDFTKAIATVPSLAIHLDREVNNSRKINPQKELNPVLSIVAADEHLVFEDLLREQLVKQHPQAKPKQILNFELSFYDTQAPAITGWRDEFISAARLDNLLSCYIGLHALIDADSDQHCLLVCNDHEEVGSQTAVGAQGPMLSALLERLAPDVNQRQQALSRSLMISADNAHALHPNYSDRHDKNHGPRINAGPVTKVNANQRYATNSETAALFKQICQQGKVPVQTFVSRSDMACGSTIGPLTASTVGVNTLDVGVPTFGMHSIREMGGADDSFHLYQALLRFHALDQVKN